jgi:sortase B
MKGITRILSIAALIAAICVCGCELWQINGRYIREAQLKGSMQPYRPELPEAQTSRATVGRAAAGQATASPSIVLAGAVDYTADLPGVAIEEAADKPTAPREVVNQSVVDLQSEVNGDVVGWLNVPNTQIDYPIVRAEDNEQYLKRDVNGRRADAGSIFMDSRCSGDFTDFNTVVYGHNMKNGSMFGTLKAFAGKAFFEANTHGAIYLPHETLKLEFFAYMVIKHTDGKIYGMEPDFEYIRRNARQYRDIPLKDGDKIITLSTCSYEYDGARMVLLARIASFDFLI